LKVSEKCVKKKEKKSIALKESTSKATSLVQEDSDFSEDAPSEEEMRLFVRGYNPAMSKRMIRNIMTKT